MLPRLLPCAFGLALGALSLPSHAESPEGAEPPHALDPALTVELVAQEPDIRTPTAVQVDPQGRIWVLENNTHFRPTHYDAPPTDRILILSDFASDGRARRIEVYAEGFKNGMGLRLLPNGDTIVTTRAEIFRLHPQEGTPGGDEKLRLAQTTLLRMETKDDYPHNGLSGTALDAEGRIYVGLGENHGTPWKITGSDGRAISGSDEGGVFRFDAEGRNLERFAQGFWNPFGLAFTPAGDLFALDNDPGAGSLCRLLQVVPGADFGFRYRYGRTADHVFLSWYGQIPGTLPPLCLVGEAPTGLLSYEGPALGASYAHALFGSTWDDHGVQQFRLEPKGASFTTHPEWLVRGGYYFRPTGLAQAPDGSVVIGDWVEGAYEVHGKGRIWRLRAKQPLAPAAVPPAVAPPQQPLLRELLAGQTPPAEALRQLATADPYLFHGAVERLARPDAAALREERAHDAAPRTRLGVLLAARRAGEEKERTHLADWLGDEDDAVRCAALQWIGEERLPVPPAALELALRGAPTAHTFLAYLAALQLQAEGHPDPKASAAQSVKVALAAGRPAGLRALALRLLPPDREELGIASLHTLSLDPAPEVRREAVRLLAATASWEAQPELRRIATAPDYPLSDRLDALAGLAKAAATPANRAELRQALASPEAAVRREAERALRAVYDAADAAAGPQAQAEAAAAMAGPRPAPEAPWPAVLAGGGDPAAGRRLFFHPNGPRCFTCHRVQGRGGVVGPDLTGIFHQSAAQLLTAIREPSREIAPAFLQWQLTLRDGSVATGIDQFEDNKSQTVLIDAAGVKTRIENFQVVKREALPVSLMPPGLDGLMSEQDLRDLLAFLREPRE